MEHKVLPRVELPGPSTGRQDFGFQPRVREGFVQKKEIYL